MPDPSAHPSDWEVENGLNFVNNLAQKNPGKTFFMKLWLNNGSGLELDGIKFDLSNGIAGYEAMIPALKKANATNISAGAANNEMPKAEMHNAALEQQMFALLQKETDAKVLKIVIISPEWKYQRNEITGAIEQRYLVTRNVVHLKEGYCQTLSVIFRQNHNGAGYGRTFITEAHGATDDYPIPCEKVR